MFSGVWFSEELYLLTLSGAEEHTALRVQPLDETYRELSRKYLLSIGFEQNNMFLVDWSEDDFGELNFYDMFDLLYPKVYGTNIPYVADDNLAVSAVYQIPKEEFESLIMEYFPVTAEQLRQYAVYDEEDQVYAWEPLGCLNCSPTAFGTSEPEVTDIRKNADGTVTLTVDALEDAALTGMVEKIAPLGNVGTGVTTYDVTVELGDVDERVRGGMNVSGNIETESAKNAVLVPTEALRRDAQGWYVTLAGGEQRPVTLGLMTDATTQIASGLSAGETVVY